MKPLREAQSEVIAGIHRMETERIGIEGALGRVLAEAAVSSESIPPFANSAMDGFALRASDVASTPVVLAINEDVPAGTVPTMAVEPGTATRIMTGAPMPSGADSVVPVEDTESGTHDSVTIVTGVSQGSHVRPAGGDIAIGDVVVEAGTRLSARDLGSLASIGVSPLVHLQPVVALMSTGDEVVEYTTGNLEPGAIRDTNRAVLRGVLNDLRVPYVDLGIISDNVEELREAYLHAADVGDVIISTGGVSMGDFDFVKQILRESGSVDFWKVAMQPGKPFAFGHVEGVPLFGLPGNPVSTFVSFEQFVRPALLAMMGATKLLRPRVQGVMGEDVTTSDQKDVFVRVMLAPDTDGSFVAVKAGGQGSNVLSALANADAFAVVPVGVGSLSAGDPVKLEMFTWSENRGLDE
jgi:molybdopterin molybdotransferase